jgi:CHAD domain-containing protein
LAGARSIGDHATGLIAHHTKALVRWHAPVLEDSDPEPLHQMRVSMRRLRTTLQQFGPALELPKGVSDQRLAKSVRRLGMARDLDVLRERLEQGLLPQLGSSGAKTLKPVLKQLRRERLLAYEHLVEVLQSSQHLALVAQLQRWLKQPELTAWGLLPLHGWIAEIQMPTLAGLWLHPGWQVQDCGAETGTLHHLRKAIKGARYQMENFKPMAGAATLRGVEQLKRAQELLGDYNDLQVLRQAIDGQLHQELAEAMPDLDRLLAEQQHACWQQWRQLAERISASRQRRALLTGVLADQRRLGRAAWWRSRWSWAKGWISA